MGNNFQKFSLQYIPVVETTMFQFVGGMDTPATLKQAMLYSLQAGGKRIRPLLVLAVLEAFEKAPLIGIDVACAVEMIHTYSLIHDDLPCMDNDDLRRGKPTNHKVFGETVAILAGDALQPAAFQMIAESSRLGSTKKAILITELARAAGAGGMVGGQIADIEAEKQQIDLEHLEKIHAFKTGKLLEFSIIAGALLAEASHAEQLHLRKFAQALGLAFQIQDDILDIEGDEAIIGKPIGSDINKHKSTYPALLTLSGAKAMLVKQVDLAKQELAKVQFNCEKLLEAVELIANRQE